MGEAMNTKNKAVARTFSEDVVCDYCGMEIWGPGIPSGWKSGDPDFQSGWMHQDVEVCDENIRDDRDDAAFQDGYRDAWGKVEDIHPVPPNVPAGYAFKDRHK